MATEEKLSPGDRVSWGVTWEVRVDGEKVWPKAEANSVVREGETTQEAWDRVRSAVDDHFIENVTKTAEVLMAANKGQR